MAAGSLSGALAAWASNPIDLIKTRLQSKENPYKTSSAVARHIIKVDGIRGLWAGTVPSTVKTFHPTQAAIPSKPIHPVAVGLYRSGTIWRLTGFSHCLQARAAVLTAAQCATYDEAKKAWMLLTGGGDTMTTHVGASMISGLVTTTLTAPVDVIKTNMFVGELSASAVVSTPIFEAVYGAKAWDVTCCAWCRWQQVLWAAELCDGDPPAGGCQGPCSRAGQQTTSGWGLRRPSFFVVMEKMRQLHGMEAL